MPRINQERVLLIGDTGRQVQAALTQTIPAANVTQVNNYFDAIAELCGGQFSVVLASAEPIERRPESAVRTLRDVAGEARIVLFGHATLEPLSRKMLEFGCDDYIISPPNPSELRQMFAKPLLRMTTAAVKANGEAESRIDDAIPLPMVQDMPLAEIYLDLLLQNPGNALPATIKRLNEMLAPAMTLTHTTPQETNGQSHEALHDGTIHISHELRHQNEEYGQLHLTVAPGNDSEAARHLLARLSQVVGKVHALQDRHNRLQRLAITDELTGLYNARYFRHFLGKIIEKSRQMFFPVTLLLFDIDNFKKYNDQYGHAQGDQILIETAALMRRCVREHDLVARIGGDEFAVVFWEKEGPRQPRDPKTSATHARLPNEIELILKRFCRLIASPDFKGLGSSGKGVLAISGGLAVFPYNAHDMEGLIQAADKDLMFRAKTAGKNSIYLVGSDRPLVGPDDTK